MASDDKKWALVCSRDKGADGQFFYAVRTTGIFCNPSCSSRRPLRKNVCFFDLPDQALKAGFRPCLRCRPQVQVTFARDLIREVCRLIEDAEVPPTLEDLSRATGQSPFVLQKAFKAAMGVTPKGYAQALRADRLRRGLKGGQVATVAFEAGFNSISRLNASSAAQLGMVPKVFAASGTGEEIRFVVGPCSLGRILLAVTHRGVCALSFGDSDERLEADLRHQFQRAMVSKAGPEMEDLLRQAVELAENPKVDQSLPLDIRGTAFQRKVWEVIQAIPAGGQLHYQEIARRIGAPDSARAVAQACGANRIAVAIPCHRVVRKDGNLSGYRWGTKRKQILLDREKPDGS